LEEKKCTVCGEFFPHTKEYFYTSNKKLLSYCKKCSKKLASVWQKSNPEKMKVINARQMQRPERKEKAKIHTRKNREDGIYSAWSKSKSGLLSIKKNNKNRYENKKHNIKKEEWEICKKFFNNECAYCGISEKEHRETYFQDLHKDHVVHDGSNSLENCVPSCKPCNSSKHDWAMYEWYSIQKFFSVKRLKKINKWLEKCDKMSV
jgi:hypothetical protein